MKITVQAHRFTKSLRPNQRVTKHFPSPHNLPLDQRGSCYNWDYSSKNCKLQTVFKKGFLGKAKDSKEIYKKKERKLEGILTSVSIATVKIRPSSYPDNKASHQNPIFLISFTKYIMFSFSTTTKNYKAGEKDKTWPEEKKQDSDIGEIFGTIRPEIYNNSDPYVKACNGKSEQHERTVG